LNFEFSIWNLEFQVLRSQFKLGRCGSYSECFRGGGVNRGQFFKGRQQSAAW
jgi:hypothetical protein